jgi:hypothetical protein
MAHPDVHARSSAKQFGGLPEDYLKLHEWFDETKAWCADMRHRAMRHHAEGIFELEKVFGVKFINSDGKEVYTRYVGEQHVIEDMGFIPTAFEWLSHFDQAQWMMHRDQRIKIKAKNFALPQTVADALGIVDEEGGT